MLRGAASAACVVGRPLLKNCYQPSCCESSSLSLLVRCRSTKTTIRPEEVKKFGEIAKSWWDNAIALRNLNDLRIPFARDAILETEGASANVKTDPKPLAGYKIVDIGCAAGIYSEGLAKIGADVTGIDASAELIAAAQDHADLDQSLSSNLRYLNTTVEKLVNDHTGHFDALVCSEVIEHVDNPGFFVENCARLVKPNGSLIFTTINKNWFSGFYVTFWLEYVRKVIPKGTHHYRLLIRPEFLTGILTSNGCNVKTIKGLCVYPNKRWKWSDSTRYWYAIHAIKRK